MAADLIPQGSRTVELGCGMNPAIKSGAVLDLSLPLLKEVPAQRGRPRICASALSLPFRQRSLLHALSIFPPGISAEQGFFQEEEFWNELGRVLGPRGGYVALVYVLYRNRVWRLLAQVIDPFPSDFWKKTKAAAKGFEISEEVEVDPWGNQLILVQAAKERALII
ncbi:MAG: hypothetical protein GTO55_08715 [Armatimonadetes bacterium]|nr:hypothetical protein [Armatimonadota bacterium]NIM24328.1 hypothetical protein [Armatimonadota bacterium]NIM68197.1 hypothetical protein [Armatimonadota bacterium]NIN06402.1 hypothetical protein [Armatimonadota bacterium]NIO97961.1 hypothetical protein [Armatimonadota bacterium]